VSSIAVRLRPNPYEASPVKRQSALLRRILPAPSLSERPPDPDGRSTDVQSRRRGAGPSGS
jgi:hypothetical protein